MQNIRPILFVLFLTSILNTQADTPEWIWRPRTVPPRPNIQLHKTFEAKINLRQATLRAMGDFCRAEILLNGEKVIALDAFDPEASRLVTTSIHPGKNMLQVKARSTEGPAAFAIQLDLVNEDGSTDTIVSNRDWDQADSFGPMQAIRWTDPKTKPSVNDFAEYNQWNEALGAKAGTRPSTFSHLPGFQIELLRSAKPEEDSWVSMVFDHKNRLIIGKESQGLLRFTFDKAFRSIAKVETIDKTLKECRGLLWHEAGLYAQANNTKKFFRLRDTNHDDQYDQVQELISTGGGVGHGRNDLALGPDQKLYLIHGDSVNPPDGDSLKLTPPVVRKARAQGYVMRSDLEGQQVEIVAAGLRNPYGIAFNPDGEMFTYDADAEGETGLPWYRPTRVIHLVSGANYGWKQGQPHWMGYFPETLPPVYQVGKGSPTSVKFGTDSAFPARYREALFILDWAYGRILAVHLTPRGASYHARAETFLRGRPLNVTDLAFGPKGDLYLITGGRKTQSALYRIHYNGPQTTSPPTQQERARRAFSAFSRSLRKQLEVWHGKTGPKAIDAAWPHLGHPDPYIRNAARVALEHQPPALWSERALTEKPHAAGLTALLALSRCGPDNHLPKIVKRLHQAPQDLSKSEKLILLRTYELAFDRQPKLITEFKTAVGQKLEAGYPDAGMEVNRELGKLLLRLESPQAVVKTIQLLHRCTRQLDLLHFLHHLKDAKTGWAPATRKVYFEHLAQSSTWRADRSMTHFIATLKKEAMAHLSQEEKDQLAPYLKPATEKGSHLADLAKLSKRKMVKTWKPEDLKTEIIHPGTTPNLKHGRALFTTLLCSRCHQIGDLGTPFGPNLTGAANRFTRQDLLESILEPSKVVDEVFRNHVIKTKAGKEIVGRVIQNDFRSSTLVIATDPYHPQTTEKVSKQEIVSHAVSPVSPMPPGLLNTLTKQEILDLLGFILK